MILVSYKEFRDEIRQRLWPPVPGEPKNLRTAHNGFFQDAMNDMAKTIKCLRSNNTNVYRFCSTHVHCAKTVIEAPVGDIKRVYTVPKDQWCDPVYYSRNKMVEVEAWSRNLLCRFTNPDNLGLKELPQGYKFAEDTTDVAFGRARIGDYAVHRGRLYVVPWIQSTESLVVEWDGVKHEWSDDDQLDRELWDRHVATAIEHYVLMRHEMIYGCDRQKRKDLEESFREMRARALYECDKRDWINEEDKPMEVTPRGPTWSEISDDEPDEPDTEIVFANIGDFGDPDNQPKPTQVSELVKSWDPEFILSNGDNIYSPATTYEEIVGLLYGEYITSDLTTNRFWPSLANHDYEDPTNGVQDYFDYFTLPNNERYYDVVKGPLHIFVLNSAIINNDQDDTEEPDGITVDSKQAEWLRVKMALSTAKWKIVVIHDPPYTNNAPNSPGFTYLRWPYKDWGADLVLSGDAHGYERLEVDGLPYIVNAAGGTDLHGFIGAPTAESKVRYNDDNGAGRCAVSCDTFTYEFFNTSGVLIDTLELTK